MGFWEDLRGIGYFHSYRQVHHLLCLYFEKPNTQTMTLDPVLHKGRTESNAWHSNILQKVHLLETSEYNCAVCPHIYY